MRQFKLSAAVLIAIFLVSCGGGSDVASKPKFTAQVSFGDSLSDVGSYRVATIASASGEGQFTINAASSVQATTPTNWTEMTSIKLGLGMPCAALTGGFGVTPTSHAGCFGYGEGGSQVSGAGYGQTGPGGPMTVPVVTQMDNYISSAVNNVFSGNEIVYVMAGANDVFVQASTVVDGPTEVAARGAMLQAADDLAAAVNTKILNKGAKYVVVINIPDIASTPSVALFNPSAAGLFTILVTDFNNELKTKLPDSANVLNVDAYTASHDEVLNPGKYNLSNVTIPACNIGALPNNSSLFCNSTTLSYTDPYYLFADAVHPTPYGHALFALYVLQAMTNKGWY